MGCSELELLVEGTAEYLVGIGLEHTREGRVRSIWEFLASVVASFYLVQVT